MTNNCLCGDFNILVESSLHFILTKSLAYLNITGHVKPVLKIIRTHGACQAPSSKNSEGLLVIYSDRDLLNRIGILIGRVLGIGESKKSLYVLNKNSYL